MRLNKIKDRHYAKFIGRAFNFLLKLGLNALGPLPDAGCDDWLFH